MRLSLVSRLYFGIAIVLGAIVGLNLAHARFAAGVDGWDLAVLATVGWIAVSGPLIGLWVLVRTLVDATDQAIAQRD